MASATLQRVMLLGRGIFFFGFVLLLSCSSDVKPENYQEQRGFFLSAIEQTQKAGVLLQQTPLTPQAIEQAMGILDESMLNANSVDERFLRWLDSGLYQAFSAYLVKGVENYRLGYEYEDKHQQAQGIEQLQRWWGFWQLKRPAVLDKLDASL